MFSCCSFFHHSLRTYMLYTSNTIKRMACSHDGRVWCTTSKSDLVLGSSFSNNECSGLGFSSKARKKPWNAIKRALSPKGLIKNPVLILMRPFSPKVSTIRLVLSIAINNELACATTWCQKILPPWHTLWRSFYEATTRLCWPPHYVCKLNKAGLRQEKRAWFDGLSSFLLEIGFSCGIPLCSFIIAHMVWHFYFSM